MAQYIKENQNIPKLNKLVRPQNPYHPFTSGTSTEMSRVFLLNERGKVTLT